MPSITVHSEADAASSSLTGMLGSIRDLAVSCLTCCKRARIGAFNPEVVSVQAQHGISMWILSDPCAPNCHEICELN